MKMLVGGYPPSIYRQNVLSDLNTINSFFSSISNCMIVIRRRCIAGDVVVWRPHTDLQSPIKQSRARPRLQPSVETLLHKHQISNYIPQPGSPASRAKEEVDQILQRRDIDEKECFEPKQFSGSTLRQSTST